MRALGGVVVLVGGVAVEGVVGVGVDHLEEALVAHARAFVGVVGHGQQPLALDLPLGEEGDPAVFVEVFVDGRIGALQMAGHGIVAGRPFGQADEDPVAQGGPHVGFHVHRLVVVPEGGVVEAAGLGRLEPGGAVGVDLDLVGRGLGGGGGIGAHLEVVWIVLLGELGLVLEGVQVAVQQLEARGSLDDLAVDVDELEPDADGGFAVGHVEGAGVRYHPDQGDLPGAAHLDLLIEPGISEGAQTLQFENVLALFAEVDADVAVEGPARLLVLHLEADALGRAPPCRRGRGGA